MSKWYPMPWPPLTCQLGNVFFLSKMLLQGSNHDNHVYVGSCAMLRPSILSWFPFESSKHLGFSSDFFEVLADYWQAMTLADAAAKCWYKLPIVHQLEAGYPLWEGCWCCGFWPEETLQFFVGWLDICSFTFKSVRHGNLTDSFPATTFAKQGEVHGCGFRFENNFMCVRNFDNNVSYHQRQTKLVIFETSIHLKVSRFSGW